MLRTYLYRGGELARELEVERIRESLAAAPATAAAKKDTVAWIDVNDPTPSDLTTLAQAFNLHPVVVEDCQADIDFAKIESYEEHILIVFHSMRLVDGSEEFEAPEIDLILGRNFLLTVHRDPMPRTVDTNWMKVGAEPRVFARGADFLVHTLLETAVANYPPVLARWEDLLERVEVDVFAGDIEEAAEQISAHKRRLYSFRRKIAPQRDLLLRLARGEYAFVGKKATIYFRDLYDDSFRTYQLVEEQLARTNSLYEGYLTVMNNRMAEINNQTNQVIQRLTIVNLIFLPLMFIASVYGMNFRHMPELDWIFGYPSALGVMVLVAVGLLWYFKRRGWI